MRDEGLRSPASIDHDHHHVVIDHDHNHDHLRREPKAQQWAQQARSDTQAAAAIDQQLLRDDPNSAQYNADYGRVQNAELATSNDLGQLHAADNCDLYQSFTPTP